MAGSVSIGTLSGVLAMRDEFSAQMSKFEARLKAIESSTQKTTRTTRTETDKISDAHKKVAASLDPVVARTQKYERTVETLNRALKAGIITQGQYNSQLAKAQIPLQSATHWTSRLGSSIGTELTGNFIRFFAISALITGTIGAIVSVTRQLVQANIDAEKSQRLVEESIRRYGTASGVTVDQIDSLAQSISRLTGIDDELIADAEALSLKFNRISTDIFPRFTQAAVDMSVATGQDLSSAFEKAGKLVNQPLRALTLLAREGYAVSDSQAKLVKSLLASEEIEKAQIEILKILESQYGGAAVAARDTMGGALKALGTTWENFLERVGQDNMGPLRQALESIISLLEIATDRVGDFTVGFHLQRVAVNEWAKSVLSSIANVLDVISRVPQALGLPAAAAIDISLRARAAAAAADRNIAESTIAVFKAMGMLAESHKKGAGAALQQTEAESKLNRELKAQADQISRILSERAEQIRFLFEQRELAAKGPGLDTFTRLKEEQRINDEHEYRVSLLKSQSQFGLVIGKQLADQERIIKQLARKVKIELEISTKLLPIDISSNINRQFDNSMSDFLDELKSTEEIARRNAEAFREVGAAHEAWLEEFADGWKESFKSTREIAQEEMGAVKEAVREGYLTASEGERALAQIRSEVFDDILSHASRVFDYLSDEFGGFFNYLAQAVQTLQRAQQMKSDVSGMVSGMGGSASMAGAAGAFGAYLVIAKAMYDAFKAHNEARSMRKYDYAVVLGTAGPTTTFGWNTPVEGQARQASLQIRETVEAFAESIGAAIRTFADLEVQVRKDGKYFRAFIEGELVGQFESMEEAVSAALLAAFKSTATQLTGASDLVKQGLEKIANDLTSPMQSLEEAAEFLTRLREVAEINWSDMAVGTLANIRHFDQLRSTLADLEQTTPATTQALADLGQAELRAWQEWSDAITGRERTPKEILEDKKREAALFEAQKKLRIAELELKKLDLLSQAEYLKGSGKLIDIGGKIRNTDLKIGQEYLVSKATLFNAELTLNEKFLQAIADQISAIDVLIKSLLEIPTIDIDKIKLPKGTGGSGRDQVRSFISDRKFELSLVGLTGYQRSLAELDRQYDDLLAQAGKDKKLRDELLKLKREELALLEKEEKIRVSKGFKEFVAPSTSFDALRETARGLIEDITNSPFGDERKARMLGRVLASLDAQLQAMSDEATLSLFGELSSDLEKFGASEEQLSAIRRNMAVLEHTLKMVHYRAEIAMLIAEGKLTEGNKKILLDALGFLEGIDPTKFLTGTGDKPLLRPFRDFEALAEQAKEIADAIKRANDLLNKYIDDERDDLTKRLMEIKSDFTEIRRVLGDTPLVLSTFNKAVSKAVEDFLRPVKDFRESRQLSALSTLTGRDQFLESQTQFRAINEAILGGDLSKVDKWVEAADKFGSLAQSFTGGEGLRFIMKELDDAALAIEKMVPDFASKLTGAPLGSSIGTPMITQSPEVVSAINGTTGAINTGNVLILSELRTSVKEQSAQTALLQKMSVLKTGTGIA